MPQTLAASKILLMNELEAAFRKSRDDGMQDGADSDVIIETLADEMGTAVHNYMKEALVVTTVTINPGQISTHPTFAVGNYTAPGPGTGTGEISFEGSNVDTLKKDFETAYKKARNEGKIDNADSIQIILTLSADVKNATDKFALTAKVNTDVALTGGVPIIGYVTPVGAPVPSVSLPWKGTGEGKLS